MGDVLVWLQTHAERSRRVDDREAAIQPDTDDRHGRDEMQALPLPPRVAADDGGDVMSGSTSPRLPPRPDDRRIDQIIGEWSSEAILKVIGPDGRNWTPEEISIWLHEFSAGQIDLFRQIGGSHGHP